MKRGAAEGMEQRRGKGTGQLIPKGEGKWLVRVNAGWTAEGKRVVRSELVQGNKKAAQERLTALLAERDGVGLLPRPKDTLNEYLDSWLKTTVKPSCRARTLYDYTSTLTRYVRPHVGMMPLAKLTPADVRGLLVTLQERGLGPRTVRMAHEVLRNALEQAVSDRLLRDNPARSRLVRKALPQKEVKEPHTITADAVADFIDVVRGDRLYAYWMVLLFGGLRPSEALALRWSDIKENTLSVRRVLVERGGLPPEFAPPKTKRSTRAVVLPDMAIRALREHRKRQAAEQLAAGPAWQDEEGLVFTTPEGAPLRQWNLTPVFKGLLAAAGLPPMRVYDLRHSCATLLLEKGVPLKVVSERLGHSTIALTADTYSHVTPSMQQQAADVLQGLVAGE